MDRCINMYVYLQTYTFLYSILYIYEIRVRLCDFHVQLFSLIASWALFTQAIRFL